MTFSLSPKYRTMRPVHRLPPRTLATITTSSSEIAMISFRSDVPAISQIFKKKSSTSNENARFEVKSMNAMRWSVASPQATINVSPQLFPAGGGRLSRSGRVRIPSRALWNKAPHMDSTSTKVLVNSTVQSHSPQNSSKSSP